MQNKYESISYSDEDYKILGSTALSQEEIQTISNLKNSLKDKAYAHVIEDIYKFHKNEYSTSDLSEIYNVSIRQIQRIFKELGLNRDKFEAQQIVLRKINYEEARKVHKKAVLERLSDNQLTGSLMEQHIRHQLDDLLTDNLKNCEIIIGINSTSISGNDRDIPIIIINNSHLYKYIIEVDGLAAYKPDIEKKQVKSKTSNLYYKGYTVFKLNVKSYFNSKENSQIRYEKEVKDKILEIVELISSEVMSNSSTVTLE